MGEDEPTVTKVPQENGQDDQKDDAASGRDLKSISARGVVIVWQDKKAGEDAAKEGESKEGDSKDGESAKKGGGEGGDKDAKPDDAKKDGGKKDEAKDGEKKEKRPFKWTPLKVIALVVIVIVLIIVCLLWYLHASHYESTDDAYLASYVHTIGSRVTGTVIEVAVDDNEHVSRGQVLVRLDPRDYQVQVDRAQADYDRNKQDFDRISSLRDDVAISKQDYDQSDSGLRDAKSALQDARDQLSYCTLTAPTEGTVGNKTVQTGNRVTVGGALMTVVQSIWVVANFKETQVGYMRVGQTVEIHVDEISDHTFYGTIESFSPGTGSAFALLPPDNATGNFTKIVQRVPVKILFTPDSIRHYEERLVPGLSLECTVDLSSVPQNKDTAERREHNESNADGSEQPAPPPGSPAHG